MTRLPSTTAAHVQLLRRLPSPAERRAIRAATGLSLRHIADELGVTAEAVRQWELGTRQPSPAILPSYVRLLEGLQ